MTRLTHETSGHPLAPALSMAARFDPTLIPVWSVSDGGVYSEWLSRSATEHREESGIARPKKRDATRDEAMVAVTDIKAPLRQAYIDVMAALTMWKTLTAEQLAAFVGQPSIANRNNALIEDLWGADLIIRGRHPPGSRVPIFYRRTIGRPFHTFLDRLTYHERLAAFGGAKVDGVHHYERHDIVTAELALRVSEHCSVMGVLGEPVASPAHIIGRSCTLHPTKQADMLILRKDGLAIMVETTASAQSRDYLIDKTTKWLDVMAADRTNSTALVLLALGTSRDRASTLAGWLRGTTTLAIRQHFEAQRLGLAERVAVVAWSDWFPEPGKVSPGFLTLRAKRPRLGVTSSADTWEDVDLLDPFAVTSDVDLAAAKARSEFLRWYRPTPYWLRSATASYDWKTPILVEALGQEGAQQLIRRFRHYGSNR